MDIPVIKLRAGAILPSRAYENDAGLDLYASEKVVIPALSRKAVPTAIAVHLPKHTVGLVWDRSGIALVKGLTTMGGVIDAGYQGEIRVIMYNTTRKRVTVRKHEKIAQLIIQPFVTARLKVTSAFTKRSSRGKKGFGSTDIKKDKPSK